MIHAAVVFDLDGVLIDSARSIRRCFDDELAARDEGPLSDTELRLVLGPPLAASVERVLQARRTNPPTSEEVDGFVTCFRHRYRTVSLVETTLQPGVDAMLGSLRGRVRTAIATSKPLELTAPLVEHLGLGSTFDAVVGTPSGPALETKAVTLRRSIEALVARGGPLDLGSVLFVGDRREDVVGGRSVGVRMAGALWGYGPLEELADADLLLREPRELTVLLGA